MRNAALLLLLALFALPAHAETYRVDLIVFLDKSGGSEAGHRVEIPATAAAIDPANAGALQAAGITLLPDEQFALDDEWKHLRYSKRYQPLIRMAWTQKDPPETRGPAVRVKFGQSFAVPGNDALSSLSASPVDGSIALLLGHYLHLDADLVYTMPTGTSFASWHLHETRKMKRDELHYLDSPKLGVLAKLSKVAATAG
jgi:hypothetical protein